MEHTPLTKQRSAWERSEDTDQFLPIGAWWRRRVGDGMLWACVAEEPWGWHLSISFRDQRDRYTRYPSWDEIMHARIHLLPGDVQFVMVLPKEGEYVAAHDTTFHLHEHPPRADLRSGRR